MRMTLLDEIRSACERRDRLLRDLPALLDKVTADQTRDVPNPFLPLVALIAVRETAEILIKVQGLEDRIKNQGALRPTTGGDDDESIG